VLVMLMMAALASACEAPPPSQAGVTTPTPNPTEARATLVAAATAGLVPEGLVVSTATPDLGEALPPDAAAAMLSQEPALDAIISAIAAQNVDALLATFNWEPRICSGLRGSAICQRYEGASVNTIRVGPTTEYASEAVIREYVEPLLTEPPLALKLAVQSRPEPWRYVVGFAGPPKFTGFAPLASADSQIAGIRLDIDLSQVQPVLHFDLLTEGGATQAGREIIDYAPADYRLLLFTE
ncbi:MAG: hypothetical protein WD359_05995, partial [Dehalococcoidia bacterium]